MQFTNAQLTGLIQTHLIELYPNHLVHTAAVNAVKSLQQASQKAGFDLRLASSFRSFSRQQQIWNNKVLGKQACFDRNEQAVDIRQLTDFELADLICFFSAIPGASRHHWGTDFDVYDASGFQPGQQVQLNQAEFSVGGENHPLYLWLMDNAAKFDFIFPFTSDKDGVSAEPWHISYQPVSQIAASQYSQQLLMDVLSGQNILLADVILKQIDYFYPKYIGQYLCLV